MGHKYGSIIKCYICGQRFRIRSPTQKFCSVECRDEARRIRQRKDSIIECDICGMSFHRINKSKRCSEECRDEGRKSYHRRYFKEYYKNNEHVRRMIKDSNKRIYRRELGLPENIDLSKETSIERLIRKWLEECEIEVEQEFYINLENSTWTYVDFYIPEIGLCIYCDGDYWHSTPERKESDEQINKELYNMGYMVFRMSENEILDGYRPWWILETIETKW